jgi:hypothetical protein
MKNAALAIILCGMFALPARADSISGGKITSLDAGGTGFSYSKKKKHWRSTDKTIIRVGDRAGSLSDRRTGQFAEAEYPRQGNWLATMIIVGIGF